MLSLNIDGKSLIYSIESKSMSTNNGFNSTQSLTEPNDKSNRDNYLFPS